MSDQDELDRYRYLQLKMKMANAAPQAVEPQPEQSNFSKIAQLAPKMAGIALQDTASKFGPPALPIVGGAIGGPVGAAAGELGRQAIETVNNPENVPQTGLGRFASVLGAGVAQDPKILSVIPGASKVGQMASNLGSRAASSVGNFAARIGEAASGVKAQDIKQLYKNPSVLFSPGDRDAAGEAIGRAKLEAGVNPGVTKEPISFNPENIQKALNTDSQGEEALMRVSQAKMSGARPEVEDIGDALKMVSKKIKQGLSKGEDTSELQNIQTHLNNTLEEVAPEVQAARQQFAPLAQRDKFLKLFPTNKNGTISKANLFYLNTIAKGATAPFRAPIATGLATSAAGGADQLFNAIGQQPQLRQALLGIFQRIQQNNQPQQGPQ